MARQARSRSGMGVYHVMLRGVNKQQIFECAEDYERFVTTIIPHTQKYWLEGEQVGPHCYIFAYCLMGNHVHLLMKEGDESIGDTMKRIASSYVYYYNHKYCRIGHLFQERFKSQPVGDWDYFLCLLRYVHQNPVKAGIVKSVAEYKWSSWAEYQQIAETPFCNVAAVLKRISFSELESKVRELLADSESRSFLDDDSPVAGRAATEEEIWELIALYCGARNSSQFQALGRPMQKHCLYLVHRDGIGPRTLSRMTGVSYAIVQRATSKYHQVSAEVDGVSEEEFEWEEKYPEY